jgi:hypothetical protein
MPIDMSQIPRDFIPETPGGRTFDELRQAVEGMECAVMFIRDTWIYTTLLQDLLNGFRSLVAGAGFEEVFSIGTSIRVCFYCPSDTPTNSDPRTVILSRTLEFSPECTLTVTETRQQQIEVQREWVKWCLTLNFKDDPQSEDVQAISLALISLLGIGATGVIDVFSGATTAFAGIADIIRRRQYQFIFVARETADGGTLWVNSGLPASNLVFGPDRVTEAQCEALLQVFGPNGGTVTVPVPAGGGN